MKIATCTYIVKDSYVQMAYQKSVIVGLKGYGGKVVGETVRQSAVREIWEETGGVSELRVNPEEEGGIHIREEWLEPAGIIDFYNNCTEQCGVCNDPSFRVHFFICRQSMGKAIDTIEMKDHQLFNINYLPIPQMVKGDGEFIPKMLQGTCLTGWVRRDKDWNTIGSFLKKCTKESLNF